jgi:predicted HTH transcriptional regulator
MSKKEEVKEKIEVILNKRQEIALEYVKKYGKITNQDYRSLFPGISDKTIYRDLQDMVKKDLLKPIGEKKGRFYEPI